MFRQNKLQKGESLVEVVIALMVAGVVLGALVTMILNGLKNAQFAQNQAQATRIAQDTLEQIKGIRDQDGFVKIDAARSIKFSALVVNNMTGYCSDNKCYFKLLEATSVLELVSPSNVEAKDNFNRKIIIADDAASSKKINVIVEWSDSSGIHKSDLQTILGLR